MKGKRVGIAGYGGAGIAQHEHFRNLGCDVCAVYDPKSEALDRARAADPAIALHGDFAAFLQAGIEIVAICTPDDTHAELTAASLRAGKHVLCEKPLADSVEGCRQILAAHKQAPDCVVAVQHQMRFVPVHLRMQELLRGEILGPVSFVEGYYVHNLIERSRRYDTWRFERAAHPLVYAGCHFVDLMRWLLQEEAVEIEGMANNKAFPDYPECDLCVVTVRFQSDTIGKVVTALGAGRPQDHSVRIYGRDRCIDNNLLLDEQGHLEVIARPMLKTGLPSRAPTAARFKRALRNASAVSVGSMFEAMLKLRRHQGFYSANMYPMRLYEHAYAVQQSIRDFLEAIEQGRPPAVGVADAARTVATCEAGVQAIRSGRRVEVKPFLARLEDGRT